MALYLEQMHPLKKPEVKGYTIKSKCTLQIESKDKDTPSDDLGVGWYSLDKEFKERMNKVHSLN